MKLLHIVADYGPGDLAFSEMVTALSEHLPSDYLIWPTTLSSFDTIGTGFCVAQLALKQSSKLARQMLIYANCAPRRDRTQARKNNQGEKLTYAVLKNGVRIVIVNSGYSLSFLKREIAELWSLKVSRAGSQFRSRDLFPPVVGQIASGDSSALKERLTRAKILSIPDIPQGVIAYKDSFGNLKTTFRDSDQKVKRLKAGQLIDVSINGVTRPARVATGNFNVREGTIAFAPGSSGHADRFWEIFLRGGSAWSDFNAPKIGDRLELSLD